jgi:hypothetical protein
MMTAAGFEPVRYDGCPVDHRFCVGGDPGSARFGAALDRFERDVIVAPIRSGRPTASGWALVLALVYFASAKLGLALAFSTASVTAVWPHINLSVGNAHMAELGGALVAAWIAQAAAVAVGVAAGLALVKQRRRKAAERQPALPDMAA